MKIYYGEETKKALKNFPYFTHKVNEDFIDSLVLVKKVAAIANHKAGFISLDVKNSIVKVCDDILLHKYQDQFPLSNFQGGAGTAINMNVNEVIGSLATSFLKNKKIIHPNDHVNRSQSTNDVNPSALKITINKILNDLDLNLSALINSFDKKSKEFSSVHKLGRTHLQDAIPTTLGAEFSSYTNILRKHKIKLKDILQLTNILNLGGTAIGNSINTNKIYIQEIYKELNKATNGKFKKSENLMSQTSSQTDFLIISQYIVSLCVDLSKIASDFRLMSSGPNGGFGEIILPELQKGSSIMPGKVNPIIPETVNQLYYLVSGNNLMIEKASEQAQLELGVMLPIIIDKLIESTSLTSQVIRQFDQFCVSKILADKNKCLYHLENSTAYATLLVPKLGYDKVALLVKESIKLRITIKEIVIREKYLSEEEFRSIIN